MASIKEDKALITQLSALSGLSYDQTRQFVNSLAIHAFICYLENKPLELANIASLKFEYAGDKIVDSGRQAQVNVEIQPSEFFLRNIGQHVDGERCDISEILMKISKNSFRKFSDE